MTLVIESWLAVAKEQSALGNPAGAPRVIWHFPTSFHGISGVRIVYFQLYNTSIIKNITRPLSTIEYIHRQKYNTSIRLFVYSSIINHTIHPCVHYQLHDMSISPLLQLLNKSIGNNTIRLYVHYQLHECTIRPNGISGVGILYLFNYTIRPLSII